MWTCQKLQRNYSLQDFWKEICCLLKLLSHDTGIEKKSFCKFFNAETDLVYCCDVNGLVSAMGMEYKANEWRLFIDSSKRSLKAVLLYNSNAVASLPTAHSVSFKEMIPGKKRHGNKR